MVELIREAKRYILNKTKNQELSTLLKKGQYKEIIEWGNISKFPMVFEFANFMLNVDIGYKTLVSGLNSIKKGTFTIDDLQLIQSSNPQASRVVGLMQAELRRSIRGNEKFTKYKNFEESFSLARGMKRKFTFFIGPTNSGKTYAALNKARELGTFAYLAPLRLLALEKHEELNHLGVPTDLQTGEESVKVPNAIAISQTLETANFHKSYDCVIVDEFQMLLDQHRGGAYTNVLIGIPSKEIFLVGSKEALDLAVRAIERLGDTYEVIEFTRKSQLEIVEPIERVQDLRQGDALLTFSRKGCLDLKVLLDRYGISNSIIYGALPPEVRKEQARLYRDGETKVLIATDAISMGLNLPIKRVIWSELTKFNGEMVTEVSDSLFMQVIGRAGRFGIVESGEFTAIQSKWRELQNKYKKIQQKGLNDNVEAKLYLQPSYDTITSISSVCDTTHLSKIFEIFYTYLEFNEEVYSLKSTYEIEMVRNIDNVEGTPIDKFNIYMAYPKFYRSYMVQKFSPSAVIPYREHYSTETLRDIEDAIADADSYLRLAKFFPSVYPCVERVLEVKKSLLETMNRLIENKKTGGRRNYDEYFNYR